MGFRRYKAKINGGVSGSADMAVVPYFETRLRDRTPRARPTAG